MRASARVLLRPKSPIDLALTFGPLRHGLRDPTIVVREGEVWRASRTPEGPALVRLVARGGAIAARAWGPGADWEIAHAGDLVGLRDDVRGFAPEGWLREMHRRVAGMRFGRTGRVVEALLPVILGQKVTATEALASYASIVRRWGAPAPRPAGAPLLFVPPAPETLARLAYWELHEHGVERRRAETIRAMAARARRAEEAASMEPRDAMRRLEALPGIGPWTAALVTQAALGDADAVPLGDYHLPNVVAYAFAGEARGTDARMLELLAPYAGHRARVLRILLACGVSAPKFGARRPLRRIAAM